MIKSDNERAHISFLKGYKKLLIVGVYPPPLGGVSVHVYRLHKILKNSEVFNLSGAGFPQLFNLVHLFFKIIFGNYDAIHLHSLNKITLKLIAFSGKIKKFDWIITDHNPRAFINKSQSQKEKYKKLVKKLKAIILVGEHVLDNYKKEKVELPMYVFIEHAFLPPPLEEKQKILKTYPTELTSFIKKHNYIISANAFQLAIYNNQDLYGVDMCISLAKELEKDNVGFIFALANEKYNKEYYNELLRLIIENKLTEHFFILKGQKEIWPLFESIDLLVRPTNTDGDAVSIREALYFNCKVIASNVCKRPEGVKLFESRNQMEFNTKVIELIKTKEQ